MNLLRLSLSCSLAALLPSLSLAQTKKDPPQDEVRPALPIDAPAKPAPPSKAKAPGNPEAKKTARAQEKTKPQPAGASLLKGGVAEGSADKSVVRVNVTHQAFSFRVPWQKQSPGNRRGLGALLPGNRVLASAELVANATYVEFEEPASGTKITAVVDVIDYEANLALLRPEIPNKEFFSGLEPLRLSDDVALGDTFEVWQFETNGSPSVTPVEVKKAELGAAYLPGYSFLLYRANGPVVYLSGSYTLPVAKDGQLAGLLLRYSSKDQVSTILPAPIIRHFLEDVERGAYEGFPSLGIKFSYLLDEQFRDYLGLADRQGGVFIAGVRKGGSAESAGLKKDDILLEIDGHAIDARGNYDDPDYGLLSLGHLVKGGPQVGDELELKILRDGKEKKLKAELVRRTPEDHLVIPYMFDRGPPYLVMGGLLFEELTLPYLKAYGEKWESSAPFKLVYANSHPESFKEDDRDRVVFLAGVIPTVTTQGYERLGGLIVDTVNGVKIGTIKDLDKAFTKPSEGLHEIRFNAHPKVIWLDADLATKDNMIFLPERYRITELKRLE